MEAIATHKTVFEMPQREMYSFVVHRAPKCAAFITRQTMANGKLNGK